MGQTLLLSQGYEPLRVISWQRAVCLLSLGKIEVVEEYDRLIRSVSVALRLPAVVRLCHKVPRQLGRVRFNRRNVMARDRFRCQYCGHRGSPRELTFDHVVPRAQGGKACWENIVSACIPCNKKKGNRTPEQAGMHLEQRPYRPTWLPPLLLRIYARRMPPPWQAYLQAYGSAGAEHT
jgi:5-methylcytosine-specific restriction endonuclease McrA